MSDFEKFDALLQYDPLTGKLFWKQSSRSRRQKGNEAGSYDGKGYRRLKIDYQRHLTHRVVWLLHYRVWPEGPIDHINRKRDDNRIENLRVVSFSENVLNSSWVEANESGVPGVSRHGKSWRARRNLKRLGTFPTIELAKQAWEAAG